MNTSFFVPLCSAQNQINSNLLNRQEVESAALQEKLQYLSAQNKGLQTQLSEMKRKQAELDCKVWALGLKQRDRRLTLTP